MQEVGARIREMRLAKGLTLRQASRLCGIPASTLSNIESKSHAISLRNLLRIASAFRVAPAAFLSEASTVTEERVPPGYRLTYQYEGLKAELLTRRSDPTGLQIFLLTYEKGARQPWADAHSGWEYVFVLDGEAEMLVEGQAPARLKPNDFFYFRSDRRHTVHAIEKTSMILVGFGAGFLPARQ
jgi:transcriptional regulator with XRE-family HTH domain